MDSIERRDKTRFGLVIAIGLAVLGFGLVGMIFAVRSSDDLAVDQIASEAPIERTMEEFEAAVATATEPLLQANGFEAIQKNFVEEFLASVIWIDSRKSGEFLIVQRVDVDVLKSGWWLTHNAPRATGSQVETTLIVKADGFSYVGEPGEAWTTSEQPVLSPSFLLKTALDREGVSSDAEFTSQETSEGETVWTAWQPFGEETLVMAWVIGSDGLLTSYSGELVDVDLPGPTDVGSPGDSTRIDFERLESPDPILAPDPGSTVDVDGFDIPKDLPLG